LEFQAGGIVRHIQETQQPPGLPVGVGHHILIPNIENRQVQHIGPVGHQPLVLAMEQTQMRQIEFEIIAQRKRVHVT
jgi:hypothetical protein